MKEIRNSWITNRPPNNNQPVLIKVEKSSGEIEVVQGYFTDEDTDTFGNGAWFESPKFAKDDAVFPIDFMSDNVVIGWLPLDIF